MTKTDRFCAFYRFHPVGQGLFATGDLGQYTYSDLASDPSLINFSWVYDCGTTSSQSLIDKAINEYDRSHHLGLVVLSHFDKDHISGVVRLLQKFQVDVLLLPYLPLHQRLLVALVEGEDAGSPTMSFLLDPVGFVRGAGVRGVGRIVFVPPSGGSVPPSDGNPDPRPLPEKWELQFNTTEAIQDGQASSADPLASATLLAPGASLRLADIWEFVPYNDATLSDASDDVFLEAAQTQGLELLQATSDSGRDAALKSLRATYDAQFGSRSKPRNEISLCLYAGPAASQRRFLLNAEYGDDGGMWLDDCGGAVLYTGDAYLDTKDRLQALVQYLGPERVNGVSVFQVMHHGSQNNWHAGVAKTIDPALSVFSSDPDHQVFGHPHAHVLRDFWQNGPVQVDSSRGADVFVWPID